MTVFWGPGAAGVVPVTWRILVTGSRDWPDPGCIRDTLAEAVGMAPDGVILKLIHGQCDPWHPVTRRPVRWRVAERLSMEDQGKLLGGDWLSDWWARQWGWEIEHVPADWERFGNAAGPIRNAAMVKRGADVCPAFIKDGSRGATGCAELAGRAGIPVLRRTTGVAA